MFVVRLGETASGLDARLGGKGASLCRLVALGHHVPPGFVVTVDAFDATLAALGVPEQLAVIGRALGARDIGDDAISAAAEVQARLRNGRLPASIAAAAAAEIDALDLWDGGGGVIVRSSATVEDTVAHSFAGIFESLVADRPDDLEPKLREVWASVFAPRALSYLAESGMAEIPGMAVVVQRFLPAVRSGVMFTRFDRRDAAPAVLVEHVEGGCEKLVKGEVTPDRLWLDRLDGDGSTPVPPEETGLLSAAYVDALGRLAVDLEDVFGGPQDVEWVIHDDRVTLVQSRPITAPANPASLAGSRVDSGGAAPVLEGVAASAGAASGPVALVFNIEQAMAIRKGDVLVTPMTNPDMVVAMRRSAAIVTDVGGMICHAAIVSRELGLPCVVGTERATVTLDADAAVTVDGWTGAVFHGSLAILESDRPSRPMEWSDLWMLWAEAAEAAEANPTAAESRPTAALVPGADALAFMPDGVEAVVVLADYDLRCRDDGLWADLEGMPASLRDDVVDRWVARLTSAMESRPGLSIQVRADDNKLQGFVAAAISRANHPRLRLGPDERDVEPLGLAAGAVRARLGRRLAPSTLGGMDDAITSGLDTVKFFGHEPGVRPSAMPDPRWRARWWQVLPEYGRFHQQWRTESETGQFEWLEVRPELVISALLKSLVQPGFEMVPRVMGFPELGPMHTKWIRCRYYFRSDSFARTWQAIVRASWDETYMADLMRRVRLSYDALAEVLALFPSTDEELAALSGPQMVALVTSWWPRWVEFFALCWFIQAQGDDVTYPFIEETVTDSLARIGSPPDGLAWPGISDLVVPTTAVMSGDYMASVERLRAALLDAGLTTTDAAEQALARAEGTDVDKVARTITDHLQEWGWMRDRDLLFEPWDTPRKAIEVALATDPHAPVDYAANLRGNRLALGFHAELAAATGRSAGLAHAVRFLHDLNVERENHHVLWLKLSYPLRRLFTELERRLVGPDGLAPGDIFFLQAPEALEAAAALPAALPPEVAARVKNRRAGFLQEARLAAASRAPAADEDDYL